MIAQKQISLAEIFDNCKNIFDTDKPAFLAMLEKNLELEKLIPQSFYHHYYSSIGRPRDYPLPAMIWLLIIQRIFSITEDSLMLIFLQYSKELRQFCGFDKVPDGSKITRFKQDFIDDLKQMFENLVDLTEPICQQIDAEKAAMTLFDTSGIEAFVKENNPKYVNSIIKKLKNYKKSHNLDNSYDPYKAAYGAMPSHAEKAPEVKQMYINGHFCYSYKFGIIANGLGIVRGISFYNPEFIKAHPEIIVEKKSDSPDEDKSLADSKALVPVLKDFLKKHPLIRPEVFLGDAAFDTIQIYRDLFNELKYKQAYIPLNKRLTLEEADCPLNKDGIPCCPKDHSLTMRHESGKSKLTSGIPRIKFVCPKMKWEKDPETQKYKRVCHCEEPCTESTGGRMFYVYPEKNLRAYPGCLRGTDEWQATYKIRTAVEREINHFKESLCVANRRTQNAKTLHADLLLAGITQLVTVVVANKLKKQQLIRSLKPLVSAAA